MNDERPFVLQELMTRRRGLRRSGGYGPVAFLFWWIQAAMHHEYGVIRIDFDICFGWSCRDALVWLLPLVFGSSQVNEKLLIVVSLGEVRTDGHVFSLFFD